MDRLFGCLRRKRGKDKSKILKLLPPQSHDSHPMASNPASRATSVAQEPGTNDTAIDKPTIDDSTNEPPKSDFQLRLLVKAEEKIDKDQPVLNIAQQTFRICQFDGEEAAPPYTCISYVWGQERIASPLHSADHGPPLLSSNTLPALESAVQSLEPSISTAFWIDAFSIPPRGNERRATLESMGYIYHHAACVAVVLAENTFPAFKHVMVENARADLESIAILENDPWIRSVWTYQEIVNNKNLVFISANPGGSAQGKVLKVQVSFADVFNRFYDYLEYKVPVDAVAQTRLLGNRWLAAFEDSSAIKEKSAIEVMANMDNRLSMEPKNVWYAMIGAVTHERSARTVDPTEEELSKRFMDICEKKGDYTFIFSSSERETEASDSGHNTLRRWRPRPGKLPAIVCTPTMMPMVLSGNYNTDGRLVIHDVVKYETHLGQGPGERINTQWLPRLKQFKKEDQPDPTLEEFGRLMYQFLREFGYTGSPHYLMIEDGFFFPQETLTPDKNLSILVAADTRYVYGSLGLAVRRPGHGEDGHVRYIPGVLVGGCRKERGSVILD